MKRVGRRSVLRLLGRAFEVLSPQCLPADDTSGKHCDTNVSDSIPGSVTRWEITGLRLRSGWYMLEIEHSLASIGCVLTLEGANADPEHLLLTSKAVCKRIIRLDVSSKCLRLSIDQPGCTLKRFTMVALSQRFVMNRMRKRLENRGGETMKPGVNAAMLYRAYRAQIDESIFPKTYHPDPWVNETNKQPASVPGHLLQDIKLVLHPYGVGQHAKVDESVHSAMAFARSVGWNIEWGEEPVFSIGTASERSDHRLFYMFVRPAVVYRQDVFHQLMACIDEHTILIYADHDHIDSQGRYSDPVLKPAWNPELLLNADYIQLPWIIAGAWLQQLRDQKPSTDTTIDQILLVASLGVDTAASGAVGTAIPANENDNQDAICVNRPVGAIRVLPLANEQVKRVPLVLASIKSGDLQGGQSDECASKPWRDKVSYVLSQAGKTGSVASGPVDNICRVVWSIPEPLPMVDIIIPTRDKVDVLKACVDSVLEKTHYGNYRLVIVDNDSKERETQAYYDELKKDSRVSLLRYTGEFNYSAINNHAVEKSEATLVVLLNNDTEVISPGWLNELAGQAMRDEIGCVGAKLYYSNGRIQHGGVIVGINGVAGHAHRYCTNDDRGYCNRLVSTQNLVAVTAACLAVRRSTYLQAGGLDQKHLGVAWNDVDFCLKVQQLGYRNLWTPYAELFHHEGLSRGADDTAKKVMRVDAERRVMIDRWNLDDFVDPAYHPLLSRESEQFSLGRTITQPL